MSNHKAERRCEDIKQEMSMILRELKDPRVRSSMLSVVRVDLTGDMSHCRIYISAMEGFEAAKEAVAGLKHAEGLIKRDLSSRLSMRKCPEIKFIADDSIEYGAYLNEVFKNL